MLVLIGTGVVLLEVAVIVGHFVIDLVVGSQHAREAVFKTDGEREVSNESLQADECIEAEDERIVGRVVLVVSADKVFVFIHVILRFVDGLLCVNANGDGGTDIDIKDVLG